MSKEKQIEEMARIIPVRIFVNNLSGNSAILGELHRSIVAERLYNAGYRKQSEGEWIWTENGEEDYEQYWVCSCCHEKSYWESKFCSECGAKMTSAKYVFNEGGFESKALKGGAE